MSALIQLIALASSIKSHNAKARTNGVLAFTCQVQERFLGPGFGECVPLLRAVDAQHRRQWEWASPALRADLGIVRLDHRLERSTAQSPPSRPETHRASCAFFFAAKSSDAKRTWSMTVPRESMASVCHDQQDVQRFLRLMLGCCRDQQSQPTQKLFFRHRVNDCIDCRIVTAKCGA